MNTAKKKGNEKIKAGTMLQAGRSRDLSNPSGRTMALGFTEPLTEMSTRSRKIMFLGSKTRPMRRGSNLIAICKPIVWTM
jgi:hypothetical protein